MWFSFLQALPNSDVHGVMRLLIKKCSEKNQWQGDLTEF